MPAEVTCSKCGCVLKRWEKMPENYLGLSMGTWYERLFSKFQGKCPNCGHELPNPKDYAAQMILRVIPA
jgi:ribosomal protein S27E